MRCIVFVKSAPDTQLERSLDLNSGRINRDEAVLSELDEHPLETAIATCEALGGAKAGHEVIAVTMGPDKAVNAVKKALQIGADQGVHLNDPQLTGADVTRTASALAAVVDKLGGADAIILGMSSTDGETSALPAALAAVLDLPLLSQATEVTLTPEQAEILHDAGGEILRLNAPTPVVISVTDRANEPRYPGFKQIIAAKRKKVQTLSLADLPGVVAENTTEVVSAAPTPERAAGKIYEDIDDGVEAAINVLKQAKILP